MNEAWLAWAAGLFEGEGSFSLSRGKTSGSTFHTPVASLQMNDRDSVERFAQVIGCGSVREMTEASALYRRRPWIWRAYGAEAITVAEKLQPWFGGERRANRAAELIETYYSERTRVCVGCGTEILATDPRRRHCDEACRKRSRYRVAA